MISVDVQAIVAAAIPLIALIFLGYKHLSDTKERVSALELASENLKIDVENLQKTSVKNHDLVMLKLDDVGEKIHKLELLIIKSTAQNDKARARRA